VILYFHGGGYVVGSTRSHRPAFARMATATGLPVLGLDYRRAPEHPFPAAFDDALAAYRAVRAGGTPADRIVLGGDSAGGGIATPGNGRERSRSSVPGSTSARTPRGGRRPRPTRC